MKLTRRRFLRCALYGLPTLAAVDAMGIEKKWLKVRTIRRTQNKPKCRFLHFTDLHFKGDDSYLETVVQRINSLSPDFICFTGDIIEEEEFLATALKILGKIKSPIFGVPGNHDHWSGVDFHPIKECFAKTGGAWLQNEVIALERLGVTIIGVDQMPASFQPNPNHENIVLVHYPEWADQLGAFRYKLILAGHSHGGQVRLPFYGALVVPFSTGKYEVGMFETKSGPLYVNPGIGYFYLNVRFNCRPEITVFEI
jgi:predicted MPP superfamily phosphohydrolase